jgi:hypothetical protein
MKYFRAETVDAYEAVRAMLDSVYGYPNQATNTVTAIPPAAAQPVDTSGRVYLRASSEEAEFPAISSSLPSLLASGSVEEISESQYAAVIQSVS